MDVRTRNKSFSVHRDDSAKEPTESDEKIVSAAISQRRNSIHTLGDSSVDEEGLRVRKGVSGWWRRGGVGWLIKDLFGRLIIFPFRFFPPTHFTESVDRSREGGRETKNEGHTERKH